MKFPVRADKLLHCRAADWRVRERFSDSTRGTALNEPTAGKNLALVAGSRRRSNSRIYNAGMYKSKLDGNTRSEINALYRSESSARSFPSNSRMIVTDRSLNRIRFSIFIPLIRSNSAIILPNLLSIAIRVSASLTVSRIHQFVLIVPGSSEPASEFSEL